jgi:type IV pilus assembly protein PilP
MIKKLIIFNLIIGLLITSPLMLGCGEKKTKAKKASKAVSKKIEKPQKVAAKAAAEEETQAPAAEPTQETDQAPAPLIVMADVGYNPEGRVDPFAPLFKEEPTATTTAVQAKKVRERKIPMTPLEKVDLSQLQLKAILRTASGNKALVEESSGKGYVITKGTYIGTRSGTVVSILKDRVIIEEENEDALGNVTIQEKELKLQKPLGEE